ncbi:glycosyltransferase family 2 protein [Siccirubricoccus sp. KC 17139]|uniref:Glycosyltransferase family 2 protein n=1 Tax=Siccirubricoccus soli TaxID=2899147 RepID=A0ABT1D7D7_9PROT|nr:glycosyltransferase family A protein [Siccirubricoccus soli]MCO6417852.1 glycosyltransferase family 2 protein [Siccirubricoccus soli]MCP2683987.1 glycosyltransferase family 2 protein [Siccirubricoccus soli]
MSNPRFSLVVATLGRTQELAELFDSLLQQDASLEVIVVDQNRDERLAPVIEHYAGRLPLLHWRSAINNANNARNLGLRLARGEIVGFPDDDCLYPEGLLRQVDAAFRADPALQLLTGPAASPEGGLGSGRWHDAAGGITPRTVWTSVIEFNLFLRRETALALGGFDERLGPGTWFGSAEGNDLVLRALAAGHRAVYAPGQRIIHPDKRLTPVAVARAAAYGRGLGHVMRRHGLPPGIWAPFVIRPIGGALLNALRGRFLAARYFLASLTGRVQGFLAPPSPAVLAPLTEAPR